MKPWEVDYGIPEGGTGVASPPPQSGWKVSQADQQQRDLARRAIIERELADNPTDAALQREVAAERGKAPAPTVKPWERSYEKPQQPKQQPVQQSAQQPYQPYQEGSDPYADVGRFGENPGEGKGGAEFVQGVASAPARVVKSLVQLSNAVREKVGQPALAGVLAQPGSVIDKSAEVAPTGFGTAGRVIGDLAATALPASRAAALHRTMPAAARVAATAAESGTYGGLLTPEDINSGALWGVAAGLGGQALGRTLGGLVRPTAEARTLMERGVALTPGQAAGVGSFPARVEQQLSSLPLASHFVRNAQRRALEESNLAAAQSVANVVDDKLRLGLPPREAIEQTREAVSRTYDAALDGMAVPGFVPQAYLTATRDAILRDYPMLSRQQFGMMGRFINERLERMVQQANGTLTGDMLKQLDSELGAHIRNLRSSTNAADKTAAPAWSDLQQSIREVMEQAHADPAQSQMLRNANAAYRQLLALERSLPAGAERFTPRQLARQVDKSGLRNTDLGTVSNAMTKTLPNVVPDSGTAERLLAASLPGLLMGGGATASGMGWDTVGAGMMAAGALGSRPGARFLTGGYGVQPYAQIAGTALRRVVPALAAPSGD